MNGQTSLQGWTIIPMPQTMQHKADIALLPMCGRINEARAVGDDRHILAVQLICGLAVSLRVHSFVLFIFEVRALQMLITI